MNDLKTFRVTKRIDPEWGRSQVEFTKYFHAPDRETVESHVKDVYGKAGWFSMDRTETVYEIEEIEVTTITGRDDSGYWDGL